MFQFSQDFYSISIALTNGYLYYHPGDVKHEIEVNNWLPKHAWPDGPGVYALHCVISEYSHSPTVPVWGILFQIL